jgi:hypothetical protein
LPRLGAGALAEIGGSITTTSQCCICGNPVEARFWLCEACERAYNLRGVPFVQWPEWLLTLKRDEQRERRRYLRDVREIPVSALQDDEREYVENLWYSY